MMATIPQSIVAPTPKSAQIVDETDRSLPTVSIVIPCRNEERVVAACLDSIIADGYPLNRLEVLVVDGMSTDKTREIVGSYSERYSFIVILDNLRSITPCALNLGIASARGDVILRMDAHTSYEPGYIRACIDGLTRYGADNVSGALRIVPAKDSLIDRAVVRAWSHRFGGGSAPHRTVLSGDPVFVDLVPFFCCRREMVHAVGNFNEQLLRHRDFDFLARMKQRGARCLLVPTAICNYFARSDFRSFCKHGFYDGLWVFLALERTDSVPFLPRHLAPLVLVSALAVGALGGLFWSPLAWAFSALLTLYAVVALISAAQVSRTESDLRMFFVMPVMFAARHFTFGVGSLTGVARIVTSREFWSRTRKRLRGRNR
jgi:glycosyltransferase involved in cell wall biosynthesis